MSKYRKLNIREIEDILKYMAKIKGSEKFVKESVYAKYTWKYIFNEDGSLKHNNFYDIVQHCYKLTHEV